jgi:hypothetical protein
MLSIEGDAVRLLGVAPARIFRRGQDPLEIPAGSSLERIVAA